MQAGTTFSFGSGSDATVADPGGQGLTGGADGTDRSVEFLHAGMSPSGPEDIWQADVDGTRVYVFNPQAPSFKYFAQTATAAGDVLEAADAAMVPAVPVTTDAAVFQAQGVLYSNTGFTAFAYFPAVSPGTAPSFNYGGEDYLVGLFGQETGFDNFGGASEPLMIRDYALSGDALTAFQMGSATPEGGLVPLESEAVFVNPLVAAELGPDFMRQAGATGVQMIEASSQTLEGAKFLAGSFHISGMGDSQKSMMSLGLGEVAAGSEGLYSRFQRRGGHRLEAGESAAAYDGVLQTLSGGSGGQFFGGNAENFMLGPDLQAGGAYRDAYVALPAGTTPADHVSGSHHVAGLTAETAVSERSRTGRMFYGFSAGMLETTSSTVDPLRVAVPFATRQPHDLTLTFEPDQNSLGASMSLSDVSSQDAEVQGLLLGFGSPAGAGDSRSVFIDDDTYAARHAAGPETSALTLETGQKVRPRSGTEPGSYLVPGTLVNGADAAIFQGTSKCTCAFLEWGYWGTAMTSEDGALADGSRQDGVHLGTWVAGNVTNSADLPRVGSATYAGHAVGNVVNGNRQYLATGNFTKSVDFARRTGTASVTGFDGRSFQSDLREQIVPSGNLFTGTVRGPGLSGSMNTSIVSGPRSNHDGVIGNFNVRDASNWRATGIVAGEKRP
ncbi:hypothetical protein E1297_15825 [Roseibium sp. RKSG952]|nr:hypothetical protein [Roseibium sp. RKSG952]